LCVGTSLRQPKESCVKALVKETHPSSVEEQYLQGVATPTEEQEQGAAAHVAPNVFRDHPCESVETPAEIDCSHREIDFHPRGNHCADLVDSLTTDNTRRSVDSSNPIATSTDVPSTERRIPLIPPEVIGVALDAGRLRIGRKRIPPSTLPTADAFGPVIFRLYAHWCSCFAGKPLVSSNFAADRPLAFHRATRSRHSVAVAIHQSLPR
jgi:hypothetical protein